MNSKLKCILIDDELLGLKYLKILCEQIDEIEVVKSYIDPELFINEMNDLVYDFCILDIEMPKLSGLQVANLIQNKPFIFLTAYREYALEAFEVNAIDYIQKPIKKERLLQAIDKIKRIAKTDVVTHKTFVQINTSKGKTLIHFNHIAYITTSLDDSRDKLVIYDDGSSILLKNITLDKILSLFPKKDFIQINKKEIVNINTIRHFSNDELFLKLSDDYQKTISLVLSEVYKPDFYNKIQN